MILFLLFSSQNGYTLNMFVRSILQVAFGNSLVNLLSLINGAVFIALFSRLISVDDFAAWNWINSAVSMFCISDLYLMLFLQNLITRDFAKGRKKFANFIYSGMFVMQLGFAGLIALSFILVDKFVGVNTIFKIVDIKIWKLFELALISQLISQGLGIFGAYFSGKGDTDISNLLLLFKACIQNIILIVSLYFGLGFVFSTEIFFVIGPIILWIFHLYVKQVYSAGKFKLKLHHFGWILTYLWKRAQVLWWGSLRILNAIRDNIPLVVGYFVLSSISIADYALIIKLNTIALTVATGFFGALVPRILALQVQGNHKELRQMIIQVLGYSGIFGIFYIFGMIFFAQKIISIWVGRNINYETLYVFIIAFGGVLQIFQNMLWNIFLGLQWISRLVLVSFFSCLTICIVLMVLLNKCGAYALALSLLVGGLVFCVASVFLLRSINREK
jgi:O-antigen/teichoic acid export membrane protein